MRKIFIVLIIVLLTPFMECANPSVEPKDTTQYQVNIEIQYNSVSADEAQKIISEVLKRHGKACTVDAKAKKISEDNYITWTFGDTTASMDEVLEQERKSKENYGWFTSGEVYNSKKEAIKRAISQDEYNKQHLIIEYESDDYEWEECNN